MGASEAAGSPPGPAQPLTGTQPAPAQPPTGTQPPPAQPPTGTQPQPALTDAAVTPVPEPSATPLDRATTLAAERPEVAIGAAFAGGFLFAMILKRLAR